MHGIRRRDDSSSPARIDKNTPWTQSAGGASRRKINAFEFVQRELSNANCPDRFACAGARRLCVQRGPRGDCRRARRVRRRGGATDLPSREQDRHQHVPDRLRVDQRRGSPGQHRRDPQGQSGLVPAQPATASSKGNWPRPGQCVGVAKSAAIASWKKCSQVTRCNGFIAFRPPGAANSLCASRTKTALEEGRFHLPRGRRNAAAAQRGARRTAPSSRITSPLSMSLVMIWCTSLA